MAAALHRVDLVLTRPNPAELSVKAGQKIGTSCSYASLDEALYFLPSPSAQPFADFADEGDE